MTALFDPGLQPERTELAWRRTSLTLGVAALVAMRLLPEVLGNGLWVLCGVIGVLAAVYVWIAARRRYRRVSAALDRGGDHARLEDGKLPLLLCTLVTIAAMMSVGVILTLN